MDHLLITVVHIMFNGFNNKQSNIEWK